MSSPHGSPRTTTTTAALQCHIIAKHRAQGSTAAPRSPSLLWWDYFTRVAKSDCKIFAFAINFASCKILCKIVQWQCFKRFCRMQNALQKQKNLQSDFATSVK
jgi:hypothetical protein